MLSHGVDRLNCARTTDLCGVVRVHVPGGVVVRQTLRLMLYLGLVEVVTWFLLTSPVHALTSSTGYMRVASQSAMNALSVAQRSLTLSTVSTAIASGSAASIGVRMVASAVGWPALGVAAGLVLAQLTYNRLQVQQIGAAAAPPTISITNYPNPLNMTGGVCGGANAHICPNGTSSRFYIQVPGAFPSGGCVAPVGASVPAGWAGWFNISAAGTTTVLPGCYAFQPDTATTTIPSITATPPTSQQVQQYLNNLPANDPLSIASNTQSVGVGQPAPEAEMQTTVAVDPAALPTSVVPTTSVNPTDTVVNPNEPAPAQTTQTTQESQTTTTITTNPNGSVTRTETDTASVSCDVGSHDQRTFGGILQSHMNSWAGSGIAGQLNLLKHLTWPSTLPTLSLSSGLFGTLTVDFNTWATQFAVLRSLIIAAAGFVAYRIIFVGGAGGSSS